MKKLLSLAVASVIGVTSPALADVFVTATITKDKDVYVNEYVDVYKTLNINVYSDLYHNGAAEAQAVANVTNAFNIVADAHPYHVPAGGLRRRHPESSRK